MVEDDDAVRRMTLEFLKIRGYALIEARSAADAIQLAERREEHIDLVLTDVVMPGMKGRELVEQLERLRLNLKILYMSAFTTKMTRSTSAFSVRGHRSSRNL